jgi:hypothetical protein
MFELLIKLRYQCYIHVCSENYLGNILLLYFLFFIFFCVKRPDSVFGDVQTVILYIRTVILVVQTIQLFHPEVLGSCPDGRVFAISYVASRPDVTYVPSERRTL